MKNFRANTLLRLLCQAAFGTILLCAVASCEPADDNSTLPALNPKLSPLAEGNRPLLFQRLVAAFDQRYARHIEKNQDRNFAENFRVYYLRQELQALIDMWRATGRLSYLDQAKKLVLDAIKDSMSNRRPLLLNGRQRGAWPCFETKAAMKQTGGHNQINDFQGAAGFLMVAVALKQAGQDGSKEIADFVEANIIEKWLYYRPGVTRELLAGPQSNRYLLVALDPARDKREHFATICLDLGTLGYTKHPYEQWGRLLTNLYVGLRKDLGQLPPNAQELGQTTPKDWGLVPSKSTNSLVWYYTADWRNRAEISVLDTAHANRTVWLAAKAYHDDLVGLSVIDGLANTLKNHIWKLHKNPFYFANYVDGNDGPYRSGQDTRPPGYKGHVWFGWHRLATYDAVLRDLFVSLALELSNGGSNMPVSQNKTMANAPLCFYAWGARLLSTQGKPTVFP